MMSTKPKQFDRLGVGLYSIPDAARIVGIHSNKLRRWIAPDVGLVHRTFDPSEQTISFLELMEIHFIKIFRSEGVSLQAIRRATDRAARKFRTEYPFAVRRFDTNGRTVFATLIDEETDRELLEDLQTGQYVFENIMRPFFRKLEYRGNREVERYWPRDKKGRIVLDPKRQFGKPIDAETGVPTRALYDAAQAGEEIPAIAEWFDVPLKAVQAAVDFESSMAA